MKKTNKLFGAFALSTLLILSACGKKNKKTESKKDYVTVKNDKTETRIYKLKNGLTVYLSVNKDKPRIQTAIAVRSGSKNDPHTSTGLSHYLEHLMFKGTEHYGTLDFRKEKPILHQIDSLFDLYDTKTDSAVRNHIYHLIDSTSYEASKYSIANEYDKMCSSIGATGTNAYTSKERTVYVNNIPTNEVKKWIQMESERFYDPVFRLFHTELEAVYEEKNRNLDNDGEKSWEAMMRELFPTHPYGTQTTIGTIHDLKNPSLIKIKKHFHKYYIPNNMAICMAGDFNPDSVIKYIKTNFSKLQEKPIPKYTKIIEKPIASPRDTSVVGPDPANVMIGFRFSGDTTKAADMLDMLEGILSNGTAGLIDLDLNQQQKVLNAWAYSYNLNDYSAFMLGGNPKTGQSLEQVKDLLLQELDKVKKGDFPDWLPQAVVNNKKIALIRRYSSNRGRVSALVQTFISRQKWSHYLDKIDRLSKITKPEIVAFAKKYFNNNYAVVYKKVGIDSNVQKVTKPKITPVRLNRDSVSTFVKHFEAEKAPKIKPVFVDYKKDLSIDSLNHGVPFWYKKNKENDLFSLYYHFDFGTEDDKTIGVATNYLKFLGTSKLTAQEVQQQLFKLGCNFNVSVSHKSIYVVLSGLQENFKQGVTLFENLLNNAKPDSATLKKQINNILKSRADDKKDKGTILFDKMWNYGEYGSHNPSTNILSKAELEKLKGAALTDIDKELESYKHKVMYYGPADEKSVKETLNSLHKTPDALKALPHNNFDKKTYKQNQVYVVNFDMKQAEIIWISQDVKYDPSLVPVADLYNQYYGGSMASVIFQELRESRALAYSVYSRYRFADKKGEPNYVFAYIGSQEDKLPAAMKGMMDLLDSMPKSEKSFNLSKESMIKKISSQRIIGTSVFFNYMAAQKVGLNHDIRKDVYNAIPNLTFNDILKFQESHIKNHHYAIMVIGNTKHLNFNALKKYGKVQVLTLKDVFGY